MTRPSLADALRKCLANLEHREPDGWMSGHVHADDYNAAKVALAQHDAEAGDEGPHKMSCAVLVNKHFVGPDGTPTKPYGPCDCGAGHHAWCAAFEDPSAACQCDSTSPTPREGEDERAAFEEWAMRRFEQSWLRRDGTTAYTDYGAQRAWLAWHARASRRRP